LLSDGGMTAVFESQRVVRPNPVLVRVDSVCLVIIARERPPASMLLCGNQNIGRLNSAPSGTPREKVDYLLYCIFATRFSIINLCPASPNKRFAAFARR
jgi:hypothetical protein